ncbi:hypothetical protein BG011_002295, partial [Mortierella polycephala]
FEDHDSDITVIQPCQVRAERNIKLMSSPSQVHGHVSNSLYLNVAKIDSTLTTLLLFVQAQSTVNIQDKDKDQDQE